MSEHALDARVHLGRLADREHATERLERDAVAIPRIAVVERRVLQDHVRDLVDRVAAVLARREERLDSVEAQIGPEHGPALEHVDGLVDRGPIELVLGQQTDEVEHVAQRRVGDLQAQLRIPVVVEQQAMRDDVDPGHRPQRGQHLGRRAVVDRDRHERVEPPLERLPPSRLRRRALDVDLHRGHRFVGRVRGRGPPRGRAMEPDGEERERAADTEVRRDPVRASEVVDHAYSPFEVPASVEEVRAQPRGR